MKKLPKKNILKYIFEKIFNKFFFDSMVLNLNIRVSTQSCVASAIFVARNSFGIYFFQIYCRKNG